MSSQKDIKSDRVLIVAGFLLFAAWGYIYRVTLPASIDPIILRILIIALTLLTLVLSYTHRYVKNRITYFIYFLCYLVTAHEAYLVLVNHVSSEFIIDFIVIILIFNAYFKESKQLVYYNLFIVFIVCIVCLLEKSPIINFGFFLSSVITVNILAFLVFTSKLKVQEKLLYNEELMKSIFNYSTDALLLVNPKTKLIIDCNQFAIELFKVENKKDLLNQDLKTLINNQINDYDKIEHEIKIHGMWRIETEEKSLQKDSVFWADIIIKEIKAANTLMWLVRINDITNRKIAEQKLRLRTEELAKSNADLEKFAYVSSHDLQEPLRTVTSYIQLLYKRYKGKLDKEAQEFINYAVDGTIRMQNLIDDLLTYSRLGTSKKEFATVKVSEVIETALFNLQKAIEETNTEVIYNSSAMPTITGDASQLVQLFQNLIGNGIKFRDKKKPSRIHINFQEKKAYWLFSIQDEGIGIKKEFFESIFAVFKRLHSRSEYPGTGIGLAICKKIVESYGGTIWVESEGKNQGTTFNFTIKKRGQK